VLRRIADGAPTSRLIADCLRKLDMFRLSRQTDTLDAVFMEAERAAQAAGGVR
jgi:hypothetical protein